ncbi:polyketide cyclase [Caballeronia udeis]|uniref:Polyketide cyclase n=1 Tax=Caballeronia udeis TaxID=1232866 RepID=A0A158JSU1_9BURK|nr:nuclear transport factor 2 family protein [Caballeronia udeis]SAL71390.1 polyketide cyclase [Caballeronia udeis]
MSQTTPEQNKALVLEAFDTLFNKRDYEAAARFWSDNYIQHSAHIEPGRDGLFRLVASIPDTLRYEHAVIVAEDDYVLLHGGFQVSAVRLRGLSSISSGLQTVVWPNTGM